MGENKILPCLSIGGGGGGGYKIIENQINCYGNVLVLEC